jgi:hypothetical protein
VKQPFRLDGVGDVLRALTALTPPTQKNALMRTLRREIAPLADAVKAKSPLLFGDLEESLITGTKLTRSQRREAGRKPTAELHFGTTDPAGMWEEFGSIHNDANPFFRPEWEGRKYSIRDNIGRTMGNEIVQAGVRAARKRARMK